MASGSSRTARLISVPCSPESNPNGEQLRLPACERLSEFVDEAAGVGLGAPLAVRLAIERGLLLHDAYALHIDVQRARLELNRAAMHARAQRALGDVQAKYVRELYDESPCTPAATDQGLSVRIPEDLLARAREAVPQSAIHRSVVPEMLAWERAARLQARTMSEWGLKTLGILLATR